MSNYRTVYEFGKKSLEQAGVLEADLDARLLLEACCNTDRNTLLVHPDREVSDEEYNNYVNYIRIREKRVPIQHILNTQNFMGLDFYVNQDVLIPRQDTEILVEEAMQNLHDGMRVLDICTGSGCILISLLHYSNDCTGVGIDISAKALKVAQKNATAILNVNPEEKTKISFYEGDLFEALDDTDCVKYDMVVSNPPYIKTEEIDKLQPEVKDYEPMNALDGFADGLFFYKKIISEVGKYIVRGGMLFFEIGYDQGEDVKNLMEQGGFVEVSVKKDYAGLDRVVFGTYLPD